MDLQAVRVRIGADNMSEETTRCAIMVPVFERYQRVRHIADGAQGVFRRYHPYRAGWVIVRLSGGYDMHTPAAEWEAAQESVDSIA